MEWPVVSVFIKNEKLFACELGRHEEYNNFSGTNDLLIHWLDRATGWLVAAPHAGAGTSVASYQ